jgi:hypothetical protein
MDEGCWRGRAIVAPITAGAICGCVMMMWVQ